MTSAVYSTQPLASTGTAGLDDILGGGLTPERLYLIEGTPGTGKTTLGLSFLRAGIEAGESGLYIIENAHFGCLPSAEIFGLRMSNVCQSGT